MRVIRRHFLAAAVDPAVSLSTIVLFRWKSFLDHVDHTAPRAPWWWMMARPRKEGDNAEPGKTRKWMPTRRGVGGFTGSATV